MPSEVLCNCCCFGLFNKRFASVLLVSVVAVTAFIAVIAFTALLAFVAVIGIFVLLLSCCCCLLLLQGSSKADGRGRVHAKRRNPVAPSTQVEWHSAVLNLSSNFGKPNVE